jgi:hypothetical protein
MTKVFLIKGRSGQWEDYSEWIAEAYFDEFIAINRCDELNQNMKGMKNRCDELWESHLMNLNINCDDECELCQEYYDLQMIVGEGGISYSVHEIDVL